YQNIIESCKQAMKDGYKWSWIDTCYIEKRSSLAPSEAISSLYRWYQNAQVCSAMRNSMMFTSRSFLLSKTIASSTSPFMRGRTLQELIALKQVEFFDRVWGHIDNKRQLGPMLGEFRTNVDEWSDWETFAQIMS
ncbi:hypothetical protein EDD16DRAFT_1490633, partial [Pisolithus croceorrhizus]